MENKLRTVEQSLQLFAILNKFDLIDDRHGIALKYSNGRTESTSQLYEHECAQLIRDLNEVSTMPEDKMRKRILSYAWEMLWVKETPQGMKVDVERVNEWCKKYGYLHKPLNSYNYKELPRLVTQFGNMTKKETIK
jgi:hypothetical protein